MTWSAFPLPWVLVVPVPCATSGAPHMNRRTLYRALAAAAAMAAMSPLFAGNTSGADRHSSPRQSAHGAEQRSR